MPNRIIRDWTDSETILFRLQEIDNELSDIPKLKNGDLRQPIKYSLHAERRRLKLRLSKLNGNHHTLKQAIDFINSFGGVCCICGNNTNPSIDHIVPISKGGHNGIENLQVLCSSCNSKKGNKHG